MKYNRWTLGLAAVGVVSLASAVRAEEKPSPVITALSSTTLSGYVDTSAQWNLGTGNANNPGYAFNAPSKADGFNLNVVKLTLQKDADAAEGWGAGYKVDLLFGPDADLFATQSTLSTGKSDFAVKQAYVDLKAPVGNGIEFKIGVWDTIIGYEVFESGNNPNFTRSYGYTIEPTTHTGILASYQINEMIGVAAGIADSFGPTINGRSNPPRAESYKTYMGDISLTAPKDWGWVAGSTLYGGVINGFNSASPAVGAAPADQTSFYVGSTLNTPLKELKVGAAYDYVGVGKQAISGSGYANAVAGYATYLVTEKLSLNARGEYFSQSKAGVATAAALALPRKAIEGTLTAQYDLWKNVISRVEFRWDHAAAGVPAFGGVVPGAPNRDNAYEIIANIIYKF
jgi:hypothetical protein